MEHPSTDNAKDATLESGTKGVQKKQAGLKPPATYMQDLLASFVVFLVALPLCMGIAIACGVSPSIGIVTGIIGGIVVGSIGGCQLQVSGPAAGLVVILSDMLHEHGLEKLGAIVIVA